MPFAFLMSEYERRTGDDIPILDPNNVVSRNVLAAIAGTWIAVWITAWVIFRPQIFPSPDEVLGALPGLFSDGLAQELFTSFSVNFQALVLSTIISLGLAYLSVVPVFKPLAVFVSKMRFISPAAFFFVLVVATGSGHELKLSLLTLGITVFFVTTMLGVVASIPKERFDHARTLRMTEWQIVWYVIVRGTLDQAIDCIRDNAAMGWSMLTMVEGLVRLEGGVGVMLIDQNRHLRLDAVYAIAICIIAVGLLQDYALSCLKALVCPYASLGLEGQ